MQQPILYEFPLNERMRNFMRLENQFAYVNHLANLNSSWDSHASVLAFIEILNILERNDIRGEIIKELEKNILSLSNLLSIPGINMHRLQDILDQLQTTLQTLHASPLKEASKLRDDELLSAIRQRIAVAANINSFDLPGFYYWLHQAKDFKQQHLMQWLTELRPIESGINLLNNLLRDSADFEPQTAEAGFFQRHLNPQHAAQMIRILTAADATCFPETSGSKHRVNIRFLGYQDPMQRPVQICENIEFSLSCCSI